jgi:predicted kinase
MLIVLSGLPGTGKTTIARELARRLDAVHVRIDSIEQAIVGSGLLSGPMDDAGYRAAYALAADNLGRGRIVIADSVNPLPLTRDAWVEVAERAAAPVVEIEITCSDPVEHRRRIEARVSDIPGLKLPTWPEVMARDYRPWARRHTVIDTAGQSVEACVELLMWHLARNS